MDNRIPAPNYTQIPNVIFDYWMQKLDASSFKVLLFICRKTFGWHKIKDCISLKQIQEGTHLARQTVIKSLKILEAHKLIKKELSKNKAGDQDPNIYGLIITDEVVQNLDHPSLNSRLGVVQNLDPQKKDIQKKEKERQAFGQFVKFSSEEYQTLCNQHGQQHVDAIIQSINDHCSNNRPNGYTDYSAAFRVFLKNYRPPKATSPKSQNAIEANKKFAQQIKSCYKSQTYRIDVLSKCMEFTPLSGQKLPDQIPYASTESAFKEQLKSLLEKRGFRKIKD